MGFTFLVTWKLTYIRITYSTDSYILAKKNILNNKSVPIDVKSSHELRTFFWIEVINNSPNKSIM